MFLSVCSNTEITEFLGNIKKNFYDYDTMMEVHDPILH